MGVGGMIEESGQEKDGSKVFFFFREKEVVRGCSWGGGSAWPLCVCGGGGVNGDVGLMQGWLNKRFQHGVLGCERWPSDGGAGRAEGGFSLALWLRV